MDTPVCRLSPDCLEGHCPDGPLGDIRDPVRSRHELADELSRRARRHHRPTGYCASSAPVARFIEPKPEGPGDEGDWPSYAGPCWRWRRSRAPTAELPRHTDRGTRGLRDVGEPVVRLEPNPVGVDHTHDGEGNVKDAGREGCDPVEGAVRAGYRGFPGDARLPCVADSSDGTGVQSVPS